VRYSEIARLSPAAFSCLFGSVAVDQLSSRGHNQQSPQFVAMLNSLITAFLRPAK